MVQVVDAGEALEIPPAWARDCEDLGMVELRVNPGSEVDTAFSWAAHPKYSVYLATLKKKVARAGGNAVVVNPPARIGMGSQGMLEGRAFRCPDRVDE
jgi:hypothetical protein